MREICKSGSMRGSGRSASNAPATLYSTVIWGSMLHSLLSAGTDLGSVDLGSVATGQASGLNGPTVFC